MAEKTFDQFLRERWADDVRTFVIDAPCKLTVWDKDRFSHEAFIGEESLMPMGAYVGKKGTTILKFSVLDRDPGKFWVEMEAKKAFSTLESDFQVYFTQLSHEFQDGLRRDIQKNAEDAESAADRNARPPSDNPLFGSW